MLEIHPTLDKGAQILFVGAISWVCGGILGFLGLMNGWLAFLTFWIVSGFLSIMLNIPKVSCEGKAVLITGCDTGFGHRLALHLDKLGFRVFACCLTADEGGEGPNSLRENGSKKMHVLQMDVTKEEEVEAAKEAVEKLLPKDERLWGLVNNAGISTFGYFDSIPLETYKQIMNVNVFGMISVIRQFLPLLMKAKGRVINVSSMMGRFGSALRSPYCSSKFAVEGLCECLRQEMKPYDVDVIAMEPGNFVIATGIITPETVEKKGEEMWKAMSEEKKSLYGEKNFKFQIEVMKNYVVDGDTDITPVIIAFEEALTQKYPQVRYTPLDLSYKFRIFISTHLPEWINDKLYVLYPEE